MISAPHLQTLANSERLPQGLLHWMIGVHGLYVYGGLLKRIIDPLSTTPLGDVDVIALNGQIMDEMSERFGIIFRPVRTAVSRNSYFIGKAGQGNNKVIHLILLQSHKQAMHYVMNNQFDIDRLAFSNHRFFYDPNLNLKSIFRAIRGKYATRAPGTRDMTSYASTRATIERHYAERLKRKGYTLID